MKIGVISDTHIRSEKMSLPKKIFEVFSDIDRIFHIGDICIPEVIMELDALAPVTAVAGNMDPPALHRKLGKLKMVEIKEQKILLTHGHYGRGKTVDNVKKKDTEADCIVFGHSHQPYNQMYKGTLYFNPGSPTDYKRSYVKKKEPSVGILNVEKKGITGEIIYLSEYDLG
ncbi:MAG: metallophosphoesterase family protein, partial [bacterium]